MFPSNNRWESQFFEGIDVSRPKQDFKVYNTVLVWSLVLLHNKISTMGCQQRTVRLFLYILIILEESTNRSIHRSRIWIQALCSSGDKEPFKIFETCWLNQFWKDRSKERSQNLTTITVPKIFNPYISGKLLSVTYSHITCKNKTVFWPWID